MNKLLEDKVPNPGTGWEGLPAGTAAPSTPKASGRGARSRTPAGRAWLQRTGRAGGAVRPRGGQCVSFPTCHGRKLKAQPLSGDRMCGDAARFQCPGKDGVTSLSWGHLQCPGKDGVRLFAHLLGSLAARGSRRPESSGLRRALVPGPCHRAGPGPPDPPPEACHSLARWLPVPSCLQRLLPWGPSGRLRSPGLVFHIGPNKACGAVDGLGTAVTRLRTQDAGASSRHWVWLPDLPSGQAPHPCVLAGRPDAGLEGTCWRQTALTVHVLTPLKSHCAGYTASQGPGACAVWPPKSRLLLFQKHPACAVSGLVKENPPAHGGCL